MELPDSVYIGLGGIIAGLLINPFLARRNTVSDYRYKWISSVRDIYLSFLSNADIYIESVLEKSTTMNNDIVKKETAENRRSVTDQVHEIKLYFNFNKDEYEHKEIIKDMCYIIKIISEQPNIDSYTEQRDKLTMKMQNTLKTEWDRVRDGELIWKTKQFIKKIR